MSIRQKFEEWAGDQGFCLTRTFDEDGYQDLRTQGPWDAWQAALTPPEGYVLVPLEPNDEMLSTGYGWMMGPSVMRKLWKQLLAARPEVK